MDAVTMLRKGAQYIAEYGLERGRRMDYGTKSVCALGALDVVSFVEGAGRLPFFSPFEMVTNYSYGEEYMRAVEALSLSVPADGFDAGPDLWNARPGVMEDPNELEAGSRVAWFSNTHSKEQVLDWFERSAVALELAHADRENFVRRLVRGNLKEFVSG